MRIALLCLLFWVAGVSHAQEPQPPHTYAHVILAWEKLVGGHWELIERWESGRLRAGEPATWDVRQEAEKRTERLVLEVRWLGDTPRVSIQGGFARLDPLLDPVRVQVTRRLGEGQAWTFGVPEVASHQGHRVVARIRLETVQPPSKRSLKGS